MLIEKVRNANIGKIEFTATNKPEVAWSGAYKRNG
jgi:hypothetical protein